MRLTSGFPFNVSNCRSCWSTNWNLTGNSMLVNPGVLPETETTLNAVDKMPSPFVDAVDALTYFRRQLPGESGIRNLLRGDGYFMAHFRAQGYDPVGYTLYAYAAVQVWAQAVEAVGSLELDKVTETMHSRHFDTVLGRIGFDEKGDVTGFDPWQWYVWQADGTYVPLEQSAAKE